MTEKVVFVGPARSVVGVVAEPARPAVSAPAVVMLNSGLLHRVGPGRLHVRLARRLACAGHLSLRFDASGLGDSRPRGDGRPFGEAMLEEASQAMSLLEASYGVRRFVLFGLCSGADFALQVARADRRVVGAILIEGFGVTLPGYLLYSQRRKLLRPRSWLRLLLGRSAVWGELRSMAAEKTASGGETAGPIVAPPTAQVVADLDAIGERGVRACLVYSKDSASAYSYRRLIHRKVSRHHRAGRFALEMFDETDHVFTLRRHQDSLLDAIGRWIEEPFADVAAPIAAGKAS